MGMQSDDTSAHTRRSRLHRIPVAALRAKLIALSRMQGGSDTMRSRLIDALGVEPQNPVVCIRRLALPEILRIVDECPEFTDDLIHDLSAQYRYGTNPSFYIYMFDGKCQAIRQSIDVLKSTLCAAFSNSSSDPEVTLPVAKGLELSEVRKLPEFPHVVEGDYRYLRRLEYIDETECAVAPYETIYGFFWLNPATGYAIIRTGRSSIVQTIKQAIEDAIETSLVPLRITMQLRDRLPFLRKEMAIGGRLHSPSPDSGLFQNMWISDPKMHKKGYQQLEQAYSQVRQSRFRVNVDDENAIKLTVSENGSLAVVGSITASQFRKWCIGRLDEISRRHSSMLEEVCEYWDTLDLRHVRELNWLETEKQRNMFISIIKALVAMKHARVGSFPLEISPLEFAAAFGDMVQVKLAISCEVENCDYAEYLHCYKCRSEIFMVHSRRPWRLSCHTHRAKSDRIRIPIDWRCDRLHQVELSTDQVEDNLEVFLDSTLRELLKNATKTFGSDIVYDPSREDIYINGRSFVYHCDRTLANEASTHPSVVNVFGDANIVGRANDIDRLTMGGGEQSLQ